MKQTKSKDIEFIQVNKKAKDAKDYEEMLITMLMQDFDIGLDNPSRDIQGE